MQEEDWTNDSFADGPAPVRKLVAPADLLSADRVAAVRFQVAKPGYTFAQVEAFVDQVRRSLEYLEAAEHGHQLSVHEAREELVEMQERISTLQATVEIFRAKGDVLVDGEGNLVTEGSRKQSGAPSAEVTALRAETDRLKSEVAALQASLAQANAERDLAAEDAAALRKYIDEELLPWANALAAGATIQPDSVRHIDMPDDVADAQYVTDIAEIVAPDVEAEPAVFDVTPAPVAVVTIEPAQDSPPPLVVAAGEPVLVDPPPAKKRRGRREVLVSAPELEGLTPELLADEDALPVIPDAGAPLPGVHRNRPPLTDAPELAMGPDPRD